MVLDDRPSLGAGSQFLWRDMSEVARRRYLVVCRLRYYIEAVKGMDLFSFHIPLRPLMGGYAPMVTGPYRYLGLMLTSSDPSSAPLYDDATPPPLSIVHNTYPFIPFFTHSRRKRPCQENLHTPR